MAARGYPSHSELYAAGKRLARHFEADREPIIFYWGDHDPSGLDMSRNLKAELSLYAGRESEVVRLGLNLGQIRELGLPPNPAKDTDRRYQQYTTDTSCEDSWELDALRPSYLEEVATGAIHSMINNEEWREAVAIEAKQRQQLQEFAESFEASP